MDKEKRKFYTLPEQLLESHTIYDGLQVSTFAEQFAFCILVQRTERGVLAGIIAKNVTKKDDIIDLTRQKCMMRQFSRGNGIWPKNIAVLHSMGIFKVKLL